MELIVIFVILLEHRWIKTFFFLLYFKFLLNGDTSPVHHCSVDFDLPQGNLTSLPTNIKSEAVLTPSCSVKKEQVPSVQSCSINGNVKPIKPMPGPSIPVSIQKSPVNKPPTGMYAYESYCDFVTGFFVKTLFTATLCLSKISIHGRL